MSGTDFEPKAKIVFCLHRLTDRLSEWLQSDALSDTIPSCQCCCAHVHDKDACPRYGNCIGTRYSPSSVPRASECAHEKI